MVHGIAILDRAGNIAGARVGLRPGPFVALSRNTGPLGGHPLGLPSHADILGPLLDPVCPEQWGGRPVLWPLWANEAVHRGYVMVRLNATLLDRSRPSRDTTLGRQVDARIASGLAGLYRSLAIAKDADKLPCSRVLRDVVLNLVELFGAPSGRVSIGTQVERVSLPSYQRRALVLAASELVCNALLHAFCGRPGGHIEVELQIFGASRGRLAVTDDGCGMPGSMPRNRLQIGRDLASLLEADIGYRAAASGGTVAEIEFPMGRRGPGEAG
jgi:two-component sensor histidine kinase